MTDGAVQKLRVVNSGGTATGGQAPAHGHAAEPSGAAAAPAAAPRRWPGVLLFLVGAAAGGAGGALWLAGAIG